MIILVTTSRHRYTLARFKATVHGFPVPRIRSMSYDRLFRSWLLPRATYVFTDFDRLTPWQQRVAADRFRILSAAGLRCLNDPAKVLTRYELLQALHREGVNPQAIYRGDAHPTPARFPVFIRNDDHGQPLSSLLETQSDLDAALAALRDDGIPLRGTLVVEYCGEPFGPGIWAKWGAFKVGDRYSLDHIAVGTEWLVKHGDWNLLSDEIVREEHAAVFENLFSEPLAKAFAIARIENGRADFAVVNGKVVVYEINTNPYVGKFVPDPIPLRLKTQLHVRQRLAEAYAAIDCTEGGYVRISPCRLLKFHRGFFPGFRPYQQP